MSRHSWLVGAALLLVLLSLGLTFWQCYQLPLDGDLTPVVWPAPWFTQVLHDPFGWAVLTKHATYGATNRFFVHASMYWYWRHLPLLWQRLGLEPISSLYASAALFSTACQALLLGLLAAYARQASAGERDGRSIWLPAVLLVPLFQVAGFNEQLGIINRAVTYTSFYTYPMGLLGLALWPLYRAASQQQPLRLPAWRLLLLAALLVVVAFSGPAAAGATVVVLLGIAGWWLRQPGPGGWARWRHPARGWLSGQAIGLLALLALLTLYSFYLARFNVESKAEYTWWQLFQLLPRGIWVQLTWQKGLPVLLALLSLNALLLRWVSPASAGRDRVVGLLRWVGWLSVAYILLLPFGGYRSYRPYLLRNDSIQPVLLGLFLAYGASTSFLLRELRGRGRAAYASLAAAFCLYFTLANASLTVPNNNDCERWGLDQLARAPEPVVPLSPLCPVLSWTPITEAYYAQPNVEMLYYWHVTATKKQYSQK